MNAPSDRPELDAKALAALHEFDPDGSNGTVERILRTYESTLARQLAQLDAARSDAARIDFLAHSMKSASRAIGALALADLCADVEQRLKSGDGSQQDADVDRLLLAGDQALQAVRAMLRP